MKILQLQYMNLSLLLLYICTNIKIPRCMDLCSKLYENYKYTVNEILWNNLYI